MQRLFTKAEAAIEAERTRPLTLGNKTITLPLSQLEDKSGYLMYFNLNDHYELVNEAARLFAEKITALNLAKPYFVTAEASTIAVAHLLRSQYGIEGTILSKSKRLNEKNSDFIEYKSVTSSQKKRLYLGQQQADEMLDKNLVIIDSILSSSATLRAMYTLLDRKKLASQIANINMLFTEENDVNEISFTPEIKFPINKFGHLPLLRIPSCNLKIGLVGTQSEIKLSAIRSSFDKFKHLVPGNEFWEIEGVPAESGKPEQPEGDQTLEGAANRVRDAMRLYPESDMVIAIESGIFKLPDSTVPECYSYYDQAIVYCLTKDGQSHIYRSELLKFPTDAVEEARKRGFATCTVGMVLQEWERIKSHKDPHKDLDPQKRSRAIFLLDTVTKLCSDLFNAPKPANTLALVDEAKAEMRVGAKL
jgi:non-canonical (house-cleaning) NTP pyrophosphatase/adenine/guanine phosphoribosyltransferase-like PRPP-binding protein